MTDKTLKTLMTMDPDEMQWQAVAEAAAALSCCGRPDDCDKPCSHRADYWRLKFWDLRGKLMRAVQ
jgi:hypothetical protein